MTTPHVSAIAHNGSSPHAPLAVTQAKAYAAQLRDNGGDAFEFAEGTVIALNHGGGYSVLAPMVDGRFCRVSDWPSVGHAMAAVQGGRYLPFRLV